MIMRFKYRMGYITVRDELDRAIVCFQLFFADYIGMVVMKLPVDAGNCLNIR